MHKVRYYYDKETKLVLRKSTSPPSLYAGASERFFLNMRLLRSVFFVISLNLLGHNTARLPACSEA